MKNGFVYTLQTVCYNFQILMKYFIDRLTFWKQAIIYDSNWKCFMPGIIYLSWID